MILEVVIQSIFSGVGSTLLKEWMSQAKKKDDAELQRLIQEGISMKMGGEGKKGTRRMKVAQGEGAGKKGTREAGIENLGAGLLPVGRKGF